MTAPPEDQPPEDQTVWTVVVAGGGGSRFGRPKQYVELDGRRVLDWAVTAARVVSDGVVVVVPATDVEVAAPGADRIVAGGRTRSASVRAGLAVVPPAAGIIVVHDAARPAASPELFVRVIDAVRAGASGAVPGVPVTDSLRHRTGGAVDRSPLVVVQTPQAFDAAALRAAHRGGADATDDATLVEVAGGTIEVVEGETTNTKLTHPSDRLLVEQTLRDRARATGTDA